MARTPASARIKSALARKKKVVRWKGALGLKGQRQEAILRSVGTVLRNSRLSSLTIQDIASELGMTKGNLYYYFKDKQDILYHCHMRCMDISLRALQEAMAQGGPPSEKLRILLIGHIRGILDDGFGSILQTDLESFWPDQRKRYIRKRDELERGVRSLIEAGVLLGEFECRQRQAGRLLDPRRHQLDTEMVSPERTVFVRPDRRGNDGLFPARAATPRRRRPESSATSGAAARTARITITGCSQPRSWR